jgi:two-component system NtrC family sensor kinase
LAAAAQVPHILGHYDPLRRAFANLIRNAVEACDSKGHLDVSVRGDAGWVRVTLADHGPGIPAELQARIFEPYFTTKEVGRGTGLGLAVVYGAVESAGGHVTVSSVEGKGTVFRIYFPPRRSTDEHVVPLGAMSAAV